MATNVFQIQILNTNLQEQYQCELGVVYLEFFERVRHNVFSHSYSQWHLHLLSFLCHVCVGVKCIWNSAFRRLWTASLYTSIP